MNPFHKVVKLLHNALRGKAEPNQEGEVSVFQVPFKRQWISSMPASDLEKKDIVIRQGEVKRPSTVNNEDEMRVSLPTSQLEADHFVLGLRGGKVRAWVQFACDLSAPQFTALTKNQFRKGTDDEEVAWHFDNAKWQEVPKTLFSTHPHAVTIKGDTLFHIGKENHIVMVRLKQAQNSKQKKSR
mgnify:CR=1 FL=1